MTEFISEWWWATIIILVMFGYVLFAGLKKSPSDESNKHVIFGVVILFGMFIPPFLIPYIETPILESIVSGVYGIYLGMVFLCAYFQPQRCFVFNGLSEMAQVFFYPPGHKWLLVIGALLVLWTPIMLFLKSSS